MPFVRVECECVAIGKWCYRLFFLDGLAKLELRC